MFNDYPYTTGPSLQDSLAHNSIGEFNTQEEILLGC